MSKIAFFGTPEFAAIIFEGLISYCSERGHTIRFAVCQPDRPQGRGQAVSPPPIKTIALQHRIEVLQPLTLKAGTPDGDTFFQTINETALDLAIVVAYGHIIPKRILELPRCGFVNVHASLLPRWRGASPIQRALLAGDKKTGVSIMDLVPEMDAGDVYEMRSIPILEQDSAATLSQRLATLGLETLLGCIEKILDGQIQKIPQPNFGITFAPKLQKKDGLIQWGSSAIEIINHCRAMDPWPQSYTYFNGHIVKLFDAHIPPGIAQFEASEEAGIILSTENALTVSCGDRAVSFREIQFEGKRRMLYSDAVNGHLIKKGDRFSESPSSLA